MESIGYTMAEMHQRHRAGVDVLRIEDREIAAVFPRAPDGCKQPATAFGGLRAAFDKHRLRNGVACGEQIFGEALSIAVDMDDPGEGAEHRQIGIGAGVPAVAALETGTAIVDARKFTGHVVEIGLREAVGISREIEGPAAQPRATCQGPSSSRPDG